MITELENLIALQGTDLEIRALESRLSQIPKEIDELEREVAIERANAKAAEERLDDCLKQRRHLEGELEMVETRIAKYKDQLMQVKSNDEYKAMQKQIETARQDVSEHEDEILAKMEETEHLQGQKVLRKKELEEGMVKVKKMEAELEAEASRIRSELSNKNARKKKLLDSLPDGVVAQYNRIARNRSGIAVAEAKDEHCQVCHVRLRPQVYSELRLGDKIMTCDSCSRILYYIEPADE